MIEPPVIGKKFRCIQCDAVAFGSSEYFEYVAPEARGFASGPQPV